MHRLHVPSKPAGDERVELMFDWIRSVKKKKSEVSLAKLFSDARLRAL